MEIKDIKANLSIRSVLAYYGLQADKHGKMSCPFHADKTPSFQIYPKTNTFCCFSGNCNAGTGDVIHFIQLKERCTKHEALLKATVLTGIAIPPVTLKPVHQPIAAVKPVSTLNEPERIQVLTKAWGRYTVGLKAAKEALVYLASRLIDKAETGFSGKGLHNKSGITSEEIQALESLGLIIGTTSGGKPAYRCWAKDCITYPLRNKGGQIVSFYGRSIAGTASRHYYLRDRQGLYPCYPVETTATLLLTESIIDAVTLMQHADLSMQHYEVLACYGTNGLNEEHIQAIGALQALQEVIFFFDGDQAGLLGVEKYAALLHERFPYIAVSRVNTPQGEDVNSLIQGHGKEIFTHLLSERNTLFSSIEKKKGEPLTNLPETLPPTMLPATPGTFNGDNPECLIYETATLLISIWGGIALDNLGALKVSLHIQDKTARYKTFRDDANLYSHSSTERLLRNVSARLELSTNYTGKIIAELTAELENYRLALRETLLSPLKEPVYTMTAIEETQSLKLLQSPDLVQQTQNLLRQSGLVGEAQNGLLLYFLYLSRFSEEPLHAIIFGKSGSGKTYLQTKVSECLPPESVRTVTSLTENTLYYSPKGFWQHKVLLIEDLEGVYNAFLPLRELMSKQSISKLTTDKDVKGNNIQKVLTVEGPICVSGATTNESIYEDNANRSFLLHIDESKNHLSEVMDYQRKFYAGLVDENKQQTARNLLQNAQRLLKPVKVINPYATQLHIPEGVFKKLRTNTHYLRLIEIITFYHQSQREIKTTKTGTAYIETSLSDIEWANNLIKDTLLRKSDELSGELRNFFEQLKQTSKDKESSFFAKALRKTLRMHPMKLARYLVQLETRGYIKRAGGNRQTGYEYQITEWEEYSKLQESVNLLDERLNRIKTSKNGIHKSFTSLSQVAM